MQRQGGPQPGLPWGAQSAFMEGLRALPVPLRELIAGGVAGATAKSAIAPLERTKILFQTGKLRGAGLGPTLAGIYDTEGVRGLFRGNGASVLRIVPYAAIHFWFYEHYRRLLVGAGVLGAQEHRVPPSLDLLAGSAAGATAVLATYPLDLVRTRLAFMTEAGGRPRSGSAPQLPQQLAAAATAAAAVQQQQQQQQRGGGRAAGAAAARPLALGPSRPMAGSAGLALAAGLPPSSAGMAACAARIQGQGAAASQALPRRPLHVLAGPVAAGGPQHHHTIRSVLSGTLRAEGLRGLYHGVGASLYGILPYAGLKFWTYQHLKQWFNQTWPHAMTRTGADGRPRLPVPLMLSFGAVAGLVAQTATYPFDVVRRQMQVEGLKLREAAADSPTRQLAGCAHTQALSLRSTPQALVLLARRHGWRCLYAGLHINYLKVVPSTAIGFTLYDLLKSALALPTNL